MSQYDDDPRGSGVQCYDFYWHPFEPCNALTVIGPIMRESEATFLMCPTCEEILDPWDVPVGNFGDLHCTYCASVNLKSI